MSSSNDFRFSNTNDFTLAYTCTHYTGTNISDPRYFYGAWLKEEKTMRLRLRFWLRRESYPFGCSKSKLRLCLHNDFTIYWTILLRELKKQCCGAGAARSRIILVELEPAPNFFHHTVGGL
jgi:hypothetical protein